MVIIDRPNPKDCEHCWNHFDCNEYRIISGFKSENCPIMAIPKGNYKLINMNLVKKSMVKFSFSVLKWIDEVNLSNALIDINRPTEQSGKTVDDIKSDSAEEYRLMMKDFFLASSDENDDEIFGTGDIYELLEMNPKEVIENGNEVKDNLE